MLGYPYYQMVADNTGDYQQYKYNHGDNNQQYQQQHQQQHQQQQHPQHHQQHHPQQYQQHQQHRNYARDNCKRKANSDQICTQDSHGPPLLQNVDHERMKRSSDLRKSLDTSQQQHSEQISELEELGRKLSTNLISIYGQELCEK